MKESKSTGIIVAIVAVLAIGGLGAWALIANNNDDTTTETSEQATQEPVASNTIVDIAAGDDQFSTLVTAVKAAGLVDTLSSEGPFTVFAPTNAAFEKLPAGTLENLLNNPEELKKVLTYHVVADKVPAQKVVELTSAPTVQGQTVAISVDGSTVRVNNATVTKTDIMADNGVIHVIDTVLLPQ